MAGKHVLLRWVNVVYNIKKQVLMDVGYLAWEYPTGRLLQRMPLGKYSAACIILWGLILSCFAAVTNFSGAVAIRFFLGVFEAAVTPGFALLTSQVGRLSPAVHVDKLTIASGTPRLSRDSGRIYGSVSTEWARSLAGSWRMGSR